MKKTYSNGNRFLRYDDGAVIADISHGIPELDFGGSYLMVHRADYLDILLKKAFELGVDIRKKSRVELYDWDKPAVKIETGEWFNSDAVIVADGKRLFPISHAFV
jgi:salicylate hydroxylase